MSDRQLLREYVRLILDGRVSNAQKQFSNVNAETFDNLVKGQPKGSNNKYLEWSLKQVSNGFEPSDVIETVNAFERTKSHFYSDAQRDINAYESLNVLKQTIEIFQNIANQRSRINDEAKRADVIYRDESFLVVRPHTPSAARKYAKGTKWCVGGREENNFSWYAEAGSRFFFLINRTSSPRSKYSKIAFDYRDSEYALEPPTVKEKYVNVFDATDDPISLELIAKITGPKYAKIMQAIEYDLQNNPQPQEFEVED